MHYLLILALFTSTHFIASIEANDSQKCHTLLNTKSYEQITKLRGEIAEANEKDQSSGRDGSKTSNFVTGRAVDFDSSLSKHSYVISLGSGPDVYLPLYEFPLVDEFHLVDLLNWGDGPYSIISEIFERLYSLAPDVDVQMTSTNVEINNSSWWAGTWTVQWISPSQGLMKKYFYLHQLDYRSGLPNLTRFISNQNPQQNLGGLIMTGAPPAPLSVLQSLLEKMKPGGIFFTEMNYTNHKGDISDPGSSQILSKLSELYQIQEIPPGDHRNVFQNSGRYFIPKRYVISKPMK